jgi:lipopolysaccharide export system permease protein
MLQNKIYQNFFNEIIKTFLMILFGLSLIALTVRSVSFLDLVVENGYPIITYFKYSSLNFFGVTPKFIPLSFLISLIIFIIKHNQDGEFVILWTSGVKKIKLVNLIFSSSIVVLIFYLILSAIVAPFTLNKSRQLLTQDNFNAFLPTIRSQQFTDSFKGFTFFVSNKIGNEIQNIFLHDKGSNLQSLSSNASKTKDTTIIAEYGAVEKKNLFLFNGHIISNKSNTDNEIIKFDQLNINLENLTTNTIKQPKIQETSTLKLLNCFSSKKNDNKFCNSSFKREVITTISRRIVIPFYIPILSLICAFLLIRSESFYLNKSIIFFYSFSLLLFSELAVRYTGLNDLIMKTFIFIPILLSFILYIFLNYKFSKESKKI